PNFLSAGSWDGTDMIFAAIKAQKGKLDPDRTMEIFKHYKNADSPRGPISIDPETRDIVQNEYLREVRKVGGQPANVELETVATAGGYVFATALGRFGVPFPLALVLAFLSVALGSVVLERLLYSRLYGAGELAQVLFTIGLIFVAAAVARMIYGTLAPPVFLPEYMKGEVDIAGRGFPTYRVFLIVFSAALIAALWFGVERTRWGAMVRAAVD